MPSHALIANFTGLTGHYGMLGTSLAIVEQLLARGYDLDTIGTDEQRALLDASPDVAERFADRVRSQAGRAELIFVNGEGTLHGWRPSSIALLKLIGLLLESSRAPIRLANFSCLPGSMGIAATEHDGHYREVLQAVTQRGEIVVRDPMSSAVLDRLGITHTVGFDSLPLFSARHFSHLRHSAGHRVIVSGGAGMRAQAVRRMAVLLETCFDQRYELVYLSGGTDLFVDADRKQYEQMCAVVPAMHFVRAQTAAQFMEQISQGVHVMITGRFHYAIAARSVCTPCIAWRSNTMKTEAVAERLDLLGVLSDEHFDYEHAQHLIRDMQAWPVLEDAADLRALGMRNYEGIERARQPLASDPSSWALYGRLLRDAGMSRSSAPAASGVQASQP